jgi:hypothetical protein
MHDPKQTKQEHGYEVRDMHARISALAGFGLIMVLVAVMMATWVLVRVIERTGPEARTPSVSRAEYPEPSLQVRVQPDLREYQAKETRILTSHRWIDREEGIIAIPIDRAMEIVAERGVPSWDAPAQGDEAGP